MSIPLSTPGPVQRRIKAHTRKAESPGSQDEAFVAEQFPEAVGQFSDGEVVVIEGETEIDPWQSKLIVFLGVIMTVFGAIGLLLERKLAINTP